MKPVALISSILLLGIAALSVGQQPLWTTTVEGLTHSNETIDRTLQDTSGNVFIVSYGYKLQVTKFAPNGAVLWNLGFDDLTWPKTHAGATLNGSGDLVIASNLGI